MNKINFSFPLPILLYLVDKQEDEVLIFVHNHSAPLFYCPFILLEETHVSE